MKSVALLATGDEIIIGDILNTNAHSIAQALMDHGIQPGQHLSVRDDVRQIEAAIRYLLERHSALITIGGLGPTSDDCTRFGLAKALDRELKYDETSWQRIVELLNSKGYQHVPENNRQQCYFPEGATIIPNPNGSASACRAELDGKLIYMLPGPPKECLPIFNNTVLAELLQTPLKQTIYRLSWLVLGMSEGAIAQELDEPVKGSDCQLGYRVAYPYIEIKLQSTNKKALEPLAPQFDDLLIDNLISRSREQASEQLLSVLKNTSQCIAIRDEVTAGVLQAHLHTPLTKATVSFSCDQRPIDADINITISGLKEYWDNPKQFARSDLHIQINTAKDTYRIKHSVPIRGRATLDYACEIVCWEIFKQLQQ